MPPLGGFNSTLSRRPAMKRKSSHGSSKEKGGVQKPKGPREPRPLTDKKNLQETNLKQQQKQTEARKADEQLELKAKENAEFIKKQKEALEYWNNRGARSSNPSSKPLTPEQRRREFQEETARRRQATREGSPYRSSTPEPNAPAPPYHADVSPPPYKAKAV